VTLTYDVRGPEFAVVLPEGDLDALREVTELLSQIWNGPGTLLLTADESGALDAGLQDSLAALPPDVVLLHPDLPAATHEALIQRWPGRAWQWRARAIERELHAWWLVRESATRRTMLPVPSPTQNHESTPTRSVSSSSSCRHRATTSASLS
jgi:hypothetical protein